MDKFWERYITTRPVNSKGAFDELVKMNQEPRNMNQGGLVDDLEPGALKDELLNDFDPFQETYEEYLQRKRLGERPFNMAEGGQLVKPSVDGSRPGYSGVKIFQHKTQEGKMYSGQPYVRDSTKKKKLPPNSIRRGEKIIFLGDNAMANAEAFSQTFKSQGGDLKLLKELIVESNNGFKFEKIIDLQEKAGFSRKTSFDPKLKIYGSIDTLETKMKKAFEHVMGDPNKLVTEMFDPMTQVKKLVGTNDAPARFLKGWAPYEESRRLIKNLAVPLSKQRLSKVGDLTLGELDFRISNNVKEELLYSAPRKVTDETKIFDIVDRHIKQGGKEIEWITKPGKTELGYPSYSEAKFKYKGKTYDMAELINNAKTDPNFKEFFQAQEDYKKIINEIVKDPRTGKNIRFGDLMQEVYGYKRPYAVDHAGSILKEPFSNLRVLPNRINAAAGTISQYTDKVITDPAKKGKYTAAGKASQLEKIGYNFNQSINDLIKAEMKLANDVLVKGRVLKKPNQIVDDIRKRDTIIKGIDKKLNNKSIPTQERFRLETLRKQVYKPDFYSKKAVPGEGFAKQLELSKTKQTKFLNTFSKTFQDLSPQSVIQLARKHKCKGFNEGGSVISCLQTKFKKDPEGFLQRSAPIVADGKNANMLKWLKKGRMIAKGTGVLALWEGAFAPLIAAPMIAEGESSSRIWNEIAYGVPFIGETEKEELKKYLGDDAYKLNRLMEIGGEEVPTWDPSGEKYEYRPGEMDYLYENLESAKTISDAIKKSKADLARGPVYIPSEFNVERVEDKIKKTEQESQKLFNELGLMEGPAGKYYNWQKIADLYDQRDKGLLDLSMDKHKRRRERIESGIVADPNWYKNINQFMGGGMVGIRKPSAIPPESGPQSQGLASLKKYGSYY